MTDKRCPKCRLSNPPSALRCDCGYDFNSGQMKATYLTGKQVKDPAAMSTGETMLAFLLPGFGLIYGLVLAVRGRPRGSRIMAISVGTIVALVLVRAILTAAK